MMKEELRMIFREIGKDNLTETEIEILDLYLNEDLSHKQIGERLNLSISKARHQVALGIFQLKKVSKHFDYVQTCKILYGNNQYQ